MSRRRSVGHSSLTPLYVPFIIRRFNRLGEWHASQRSSLAWRLVKTWLISFVVYSLFNSALITKIGNSLACIGNSVSSTDKRSVFNFLHFWERRTAVITSRNKRQRHTMIYKTLLDSIILADSRLNRRKLFLSFPDVFSENRLFRTKYEV